MKRSEFFTRLFFVLLLALPFSVSAESPVNINTASAEVIASSLKGIGPSKARAIVAYRQEYGPFNNVSELAMVKGIGVKTLEKNKGMITVESAAVAEIKE